MKLRAAFASLALGAMVAAAVVATLVTAQSPPVPDFYWPYGTVQLSGGNISPQAQPIIAFVNGKSCGNDETQYVEPNSDSPPIDGGKTVYAIDVLADGQQPGQRPGCGTAGAPVTLYLPLLGRIAIQQPLFKVGGERVDLDLGLLLGSKRRLPMIAADGAP